MTATQSVQSLNEYSPSQVIAARRALWQRDLARANQLPPDSNDWSTFLALAGRGFGKTRLASEWLAWQAIQNANTRWAIVAPTFGDVRDTCAEGPSGIVAILREYEVLENYNRSMGEIILNNKSRIKLFSAEEPDRLRGPNFHGGWFDEMAAMNPAAWDQYKFALRLGQHPQTVVTTTPRPTKIIKEMSKAEDTLVVRGSTFDNAANLAPAALAALRLKYEGTRLGRQELFGEIIDDNPGALWQRANLDEHRVESHPPLMRIVVAIDPAVTSGEDSDSTGIVVAGMTSNGEYYVLEDLTIKASPDGWARAAVNAYHNHKADRIVAETNNGGDMIEHLIRQVDPSVSFRKVTATRGKLLRAEPVAALSEQGRLHLVGTYPELEDQLCNFTHESKDSPDRLDAMVWGVTDLMATANSMLGLSQLAKFCLTCKLPASKTATVCPSCHTPFGE
jgi:predicted phage terminase large subunit-like protein